MYLARVLWMGAVAPAILKNRLLALQFLDILVLQEKNVGAKVRSF